MKKGRGHDEERKKVKRQRGKKLKKRGSHADGMIRKCRGQEEERKKVKKQSDKK